MQSYHVMSVLCHILSFEILCIATRITVSLYRVRVWDVIILCPNAIFLLYLAIKMRTAVVKLHRSSSPVLTTFFLLVRVCTVHTSV